MPRSPKRKPVRREVDRGPTLPFGDVLPAAVPRRPPLKIKKELEQAHKALAQAGFSFASMLARRRMNLTSIELATAQVKTCGIALEKLVERIKEEL